MTRDMNNLKKKLRKLKTNKKIQKHEELTHDTSLTSLTPY